MTKARTISPAAAILVIISIAILPPNVFSNRVLDSSRSPSAPPSVQIGALTFGLFLQHLMSQVQDAIDSARNAGRSVVIQAGTEVNIAIENARNAYADSLNETMNRLDTTAKNVADNLQAMVNKLVTGTEQLLAEATVDAQQIVNSLPFRAHEPQLTRVNPRFVVPSQQPNPVVLNFKGNFEFAAQNRFTPTLDVKGRKYNPAENTTQSLKFLVPASELTSPAALAEPGKFSLMNVTLSVPWQTGWIFKKRRESTYRVMIGSLPSSVGTITLIHTTTHSDRRTRRFESSEMYQTSANDGDNNDHIDVPHAVSPESGWHVVRNHSSLNKKFEKGEHHENFVSDDGDRVVYNVTTQHIGFCGLGCHKDSGQVRFTISFDEYQDFEVPQENSESVSLRWGDSKSFNYAIGTWKIVFDAFDGAHYELTGTNANNPYLLLENQGGNLVISTRTPTNLIGP